MQACPNEEIVHAFVEGRMDADSRRALEGHFDRCGDCSGLVLALLRQKTLSSAHAGAAVDAASMTAPLGPVRGLAFQLAEGDRFGRYIILREAGVGGMGAVYAAHDTALDRKVALKLMARGRSPGAVARLLSEASVMARLNHPNVVTVYDAGIVDDEPFLAMELVEGQTLAAWRTPERTVRQIVNAMAAAARGLAAGHAAGIVHRDVKPQNILIDGSRVRVTDFGLSAPSTAAGTSSDDERISGTPGYMAPEQWAGRAVDPRTDVFGFCATLYKLLYGVTPFAGDSVSEVRAATLTGRIAAPASGVKVPARLHRLVTSGLATDPAARPADLDRLADALLADPAVAVRRGIIAGVACVAVVAAFWVGGWLKASPERACRAGARVIDASFTTAQRRAIADRYQQVGQAPAWAALEHRLDAFVQQWRDLHGQTCSASFGQHVQTAAVLDLRMSCLGGQRAVLEAFVADLNQATPGQLIAAAGARMPDAAECGLTARAGVKPLPGSAADRAEVAVIEADIAKAMAGVKLGDYPKAQAAVDRAVVGARKLGYEPALAHALTTAGLIEGRRGNGDEEPADPAAAGKATVDKSEKLFQEALVLAERGGDDFRKATAAIELVMTYFMADRFREAVFWSDLASALTDRLGDPPRQRADLLLNQGYLYIAQERHADARAAFTRAIELSRKSAESGDSYVVAPMMGLCNAIPKETESLSCWRKALAFTQAALGPKHPDVSTAYNGLYGALRKDPRTLPEACEMLGKAVAIDAAALSPRNHNVIAGLSNQASCLVQSNKFAEAAPIYQDLLTRVVNRSSQRSHVRQGYGLLLQATGDLDGAVTYLRQAADDRRLVFGPTHARTMLTISNLAQALCKNHQPAQALREVDQAIAACAEKGVTPEALPDMHLIRATALLDLGRPVEAVAAVRQTLHLYDLNHVAEPDRVSAIGLLGQATRALGHRREALVQFERALALLPVSEAEVVDRADAAYWVAQTLAESAPGKPPVRACRLAKEAVEGFRQIVSKEFAPEHQAAETLWSRLGRRGC
jgi:tetratricopeptide (TPR) repeat protein